MEEFDKQLLEQAGAAHAKAMTEYYGKAGSYGGKVIDKDGDVTWGIFHGDDGTFGMSYETPEVVKRLEWGPPGKWYATQTDRFRSPAGNPTSDSYSVDPFPFVMMFATALDRLNFSAGEKGTALRCCLCDKQPWDQSLPSINGHYALCEEHHNDWASGNLYPQGRYAGHRHLPRQQHILYSLGLLDIATGRGPEAGDWEGVLMRRGYSARLPEFPGEPAHPFT